MFYPIYKCRTCGEVETDYKDEHKSMYGHDMKLAPDMHKMHECSSNDHVATLGVMDLVGFDQRK